jgi:hypothetical protein
MKKCRSAVPAIDEFLTQFAKYEKVDGNNIGIYYKWKWLYPTFMDRAHSPPKMWKAPKTADASCSGVPAQAYVAAVCVSSCATPEQLILAQDRANGKLEYVKFVDAWNEKFAFVATLTSQSTMSSKFVTKTKVDQWVTELEDGDHEILVFKMVSGRELRLTPNHPVVTDQGTMKLAEDFRVGENLVRLGGERDRIVSIQSVQHFGKVYNVFVQSNELHKNIVVTNGYLNGTAYFQNDGAGLLNRRLLRGGLIRGVLEK